MRVLLLTILLPALAWAQPFGSGLKGVGPGSSTNLPWCQFGPAFVDCPADPTAGACVTLKEPTGHGLNAVQLCVPPMPSGLSQTRTILMNADGTLPAAQAENLNCANQTAIYDTGGHLTCGAAAPTTTTTVATTTSTSLTTLTTSTSSSSTSSTSTSSTSSTSTTLTGGSNPVDWTNDPAIVALYDFEASPPDGTASGTTCGSTCNLTTITNGPVTASTGTRGVDYVYGSNAASLAANQDIRVLNNAGLGFSGAETLVLWTKFPSLPTNNGAVMATNFNYQNFGLRMYMPSFDFGHVHAVIGQSSSYDDDHVAGYSLATGSWYFNYVGAQAGAGAGENGMVGVMHGDNATGFVKEANVGQHIGDMVNQFGVNNGNSGFNDQTFQPTAVILDEGIISNIAMTQATLCRICSCGLDGAHPPDTSAACTCSGASWTGTGANTTMCGGCSLSEACNAAHPSSR
jgi:hypothetical protein